MIILENILISEKTCVHQVKANRSSYLNDQEEHCRSCDGSQKCPYDKYKPIGSTQIPFRKGKYSALFFGGKHE